MNYDSPGNESIGIEIFNSNSVLVKRLQWEKGPGEHIIQISTESISPGIYFIRIINRETAIFKKIIIGIEQIP